MFVIIGVGIVLVSLFSGYLMAGGDMIVLLQISEFVIIGGAAIGSFVAANPLAQIKQTIAALLKTLKGANANKEAYIQLMQLLYELFQYAKREGLIALEVHAERPEESSIFTKYPTFLANHHGVEFLCDTLKVLLSGGVPAADLEDLMDADLEIMHAEESHPPKAVNVVAEAFPGLGIVAAVLGIVITMGAINEGAESVGHHVAAALVGTFLGVLLSYGVIGPIAKNMELVAELDHRYLVCIKAALLSFAKGAPASVAIEYARRSINPEMRPTFAESEEAIKQAK